VGKETAGERSGNTAAQNCKYSQNTGRKGPLGKDLMREQSMNVCQRFPGGLEGYRMGQDLVFLTFKDRPLPLKGGTQGSDSGGGKGTQSLEGSVRTVKGRRGIWGLVKKQGPLRHDVKSPNSFGGTEEAEGCTTADFRLGKRGGDLSKD